MNTKRNKLYLFLMTACTAGGIWVVLNRAPVGQAWFLQLGCLFKQVTGVPCPSCGATRSVDSITRGEFSEAFFHNPLGYLIASIILIAPVWIIADLTGKNDSLLRFYTACERALRKPGIAGISICSLLLIWIWNLMKHL